MLFLKSASIGTAWFMPGLFECTCIIIFLYVEDYKYINHSEHPRLQFSNTSKVIRNFEALISIEINRHILNQG